jgi:hypothetical protein
MAAGSGKSHGGSPTDRPEIERDPERAKDAPEVKRPRRGPEVQEPLEDEPEVPSEPDLDRPEIGETPRAPEGGADVDERGRGGSSDVERGVGGLGDDRADGDEGSVERA